MALLVQMVAAAHAGASGFAVREQSGTALGNAFAGAAAGADDLSYMFFNPAGLTLQSGNQISAGGTAVLPSLKVRGARGSTGGGVPIAGNLGGRNVGEDAVVPTLYGLWDLQHTFDLQQNIKFGIGVNVPYGVETDYRDGWVGRYYALQSQVTAVDVNPALAWEIVDGFSVAAGLQVQYIQARLTNAIDFGSIGRAFGIPGAAPGQQDGHGRVEGDDVGYGYTLGVLWEPWQGTRLGAGYRSAVHQTLVGDAEFDTGGATGGRVAAATGLFHDTGSRANLTTPEMVTFGVHQEVSPEVAVMANAEWTRWSRFQDLTIKYDNARQPNTYSENDWLDTWCLAFGATWRPDDAWRLRTGFAWDQDPSRERRRTPRIPTDDRWWLSFGAGWTPFASLTLDAGYTHVFFEDASLRLRAQQSGNAFRGNLNGTVESSADIFSLQARWVF